MQVDDDDDSTSYTIILQNAETVALISPPGGKSYSNYIFYHIFRLSSLDYHILWQQDIKIEPFL